MITNLESLMAHLEGSGVPVSQCDFVLTILPSKALYTAGSAGFVIDNFNIPPVGIKFNPSEIVGLNIASVQTPPMIVSIYVDKKSVEFLKSLAINQFKDGMLLLEPIKFKPTVIVGIMKGSEIIAPMVLKLEGCTFDSIEFKNSVKSTEFSICILTISYFDFEVTI